MADPHDVLGVNRDADEETVKQAYRELVKEHHPDQGGDAEKFHEIRTAYEQITTGSGNQNETASRGTVSITCSDCGQTKTVAKEDVTVIRGKRYCEDCYVETSCERCGESIIDTEQKLQELGETVLCSDCTVETRCANCHKSVRVDPRKQSLDDVFYCSECSAGAACSRCGKTVPPAKAPICDDCTGETGERLPGSTQSRRATLAALGVLSAGVGLKAVQEGYFTGSLGQPEPDLERTEQIRLTDESFYAERFTAPGNARLEYELEIESGSVTSRLYTDAEYEKFRQGFDERNTYEEGDHLDSCSVQSHSDAGEFGCGLPGAGGYALVLIRNAGETSQGVLTYRIFA